MFAAADAWEKEHEEYEDICRRADEELAHQQARIEELEMDARNRVVFKHVDVTPNDDLPLRILRAYRQDCNYAWATTADGMPSDSPLVKALNELQEQRAAILDKAIAALTGNRIEELDALLRRCRAALGPMAQDDNEECNRLVDDLDAALAGKRPIAEKN